ncbi:3D-(3,5/4)-trihydroxycyclohexane-1,2-dione acylhydrolase (decyclizing) [Embleya scabrispora]|uniref:3D-(3,5/4)-trihydroxycyclohexane-1,2-dione acylhydrolase (Decyclizing) n=1 Tax=Embleya scabrispora TaxID=159449 RepID=A0A1T3NNH6_9ACTN|nr:3D-(3,5/4)-trihydroxycyclohexane-1,2-dione acylhydrolase (decyclizing) [Embleya scabrispora]OPC78298.1 3D-(3,5/4)-trihydroxycyclohexane-1,2-dione acylhydrolase (decyclizing) [Embleya scabrispora]
MTSTTSTRTAGATVRLTTAQALVRWLIAQGSELVDGRRVPLFPGVFAIFGHGNVLGLGDALHEAGGQLPVWRGQNEQGMALAAVGYARATQRRQVMIATSSIGPGALNMVTAAGVAHANRLPLLLLVGDTFASRAPDPVLQQVEHFHDPSGTVNDAFRSVSRYWDRITRPEQLIATLPQVARALTDPADCGPVTLALPQDVQAQAYDFPLAMFAPRLHRPVRPRPDLAELADAAALLRAAARPLLVVGGGVRYADAAAEVLALAEAYGVPFAETVAGRTLLPHEHPLHAGPLGITGSASANALAADADLILAVGTRLQDFTTASWTVFAADARLVSINAARFDAVKRGATPVTGDAREALRELTPLLGDWRPDPAWTARAASERRAWDDTIDALRAPGDPAEPPTYAQVVGVVNRLAGPADYVLTAAGGLPGELVGGWRSVGPVGAPTMDVEYGFSCMGYEIAGAWGAAMARPEGVVTTLLGDGSYLMLNSEVYSAVLSGHRFVAVVCDNGGYAVIARLQEGQGAAPFNNMITDCRGPGAAADHRVDFAAHAAALGAEVFTADTVADLEKAYAAARASRRPSVVVVRTSPNHWTESGAWWEVGVPELSARPEVTAARRRMDEARAERAARN